MAPPRSKAKKRPLAGGAVLSRRGHVAQKEIEKAQSQEPGLEFAKSAFKRIVQGISKEQQEIKKRSATKKELDRLYHPIRFEPAAYEGLQWAAEGFLVEVLERARKGTQAAGRETLLARDVFNVVDNETQVALKAKDRSGGPGADTELSNVDTC